MVVVGEPITNRPGDVEVSGDGNAEAIRVGDAEAEATGNTAMPLETSNTFTGSRIKKEHLLYNQ